MTKPKTYYRMRNPLTGFVGQEIDEIPHDLPGREDVPVEIHEVAVMDEVASYLMRTHAYRLCQKKNCRVCTLLAKLGRGEG